MKIKVILILFSIPMGITATESWPVHLEKTKLNEETYQTWYAKDIARRMAPYV